MRLVVRAAGGEKEQGRSVLASQPLDGIGYWARDSISKTKENLHKTRLEFM